MNFRARMDHPGSWASCYHLPNHVSKDDKNEGGLEEIFPTVIDQALLSQWTPRDLIAAPLNRGEISTLKVTERQVWSKERNPSKSTKTWMLRNTKLRRNNGQATGEESKHLSPRPIVHLNPSGRKCQVSAPQIVAKQELGRLCKPQEKLTGQSEETAKGTPWPFPQKLPDLLVLSLASFSLHIQPSPGLWSPCHGASAYHIPPRAAPTLQTVHMTPSRSTCPFPGGDCFQNPSVVGRIMAPKRFTS